MQLRRLNLSIVLLAVLAGLALVAMFAFASFDRISAPNFRIAYGVHLALQAAAVLLALVLFGKLAALSRWPSWLPLLCLGLFGALILAALVPPVTDAQALSTSLFLPRVWLGADRLSEIEWHEMSYYPVLVELGFVPLLKYAAPQLCSLYHFSYLILLGALAAAVVYERTEEPESALAALLMTISLPLCQRIAATPLVQLGTAVYVTAAVFFLIRWAERGGALMVLCAGLALGLSVHSSSAGMLAGMLLLALTIALGAQARKSALAVSGAFIAAAVLVAVITTPLMIRNLLWTTNPFFPLLKNIVGSSNIAFKFDPQRLAPLPERLQALGMDWLDLLSLPIQMIAFGRDFDQRSFNGMLSPLLLLAIFPFFTQQRPAWLSFTYFFSLFYAVFTVFLQPLEVIELAPIGGVVLILTGLGFQRAASFFGQHRRMRIYTLLLGVQLLFALSYGGTLLARREALARLFGGDSADAYLTRHLNDYAFIQYVNSAVSPDTLTLLELMPSSFFYYQRTVISEGGSTADQMAQWISQQRTRRLLEVSLHMMGVSHIAMNTDALHRALKAQLTPRDFAVWLDFLARSLDLLETKGPYAIYRLAPGRAEGQGQAAWRRLDALTAAGPPPLVALARRVS